MDLGQHDAEIWVSLRHWERKPLLRKIYRGFYERIANQVRRDLAGLTVEVGSGIGNIKEVLPDCLRTDLFPNPWLDRQENAYDLGFADGEVANLILFDVFHHLRYPGNAFAQFARVLAPGGRLILFEPCISLLGLIVYGLMHHEPLGLGNPIQWDAPQGWTYQDDSYYAAQANAYRAFVLKNPAPPHFRVLHRLRYSCLSYVASGGYRGPQLYPISAYPLMMAIDRICDLFPGLFATRLMVVLERI